MKRVLSLLMAVLMVVSVSSFVVMADEAAETPVPAELVQPVGVYFDGEDALEPVVLGTTEQKVWEGNVPNTTTNENGASGVTFVYKVDGVDTPIKPGAWDVAFGGITWSANNWFYNNEWKGVWANQIVKFDQSGYYYTFLPARISTEGAPGLIKDVTAFTLFRSGAVSGNPVVENANENATLTMLAVIENNLQPVVNFYGLDGEFLGTTTYKYTDGIVHTGATADHTDVLAAHGMLKTPTELAQTIEGIELPTKESDAQYRYELIFKDKAGNKVDGVYKSQDLYADFEAVDNTRSDYTFVDAAGAQVGTGIGKKGEKATFEGTNPEKATDDDYTYTFAGWSVDGETVIDLDTYILNDDKVVFIPVYEPDLKLKADIVVADQVAMGEEFEISFKLNRTDLSVDVLEGTVEDITSGEITVSFRNALFSTGDETVDAAGEIVIPFTSVDENGVINATLKLTAAANAAGTSAVKVTAGKAIADEIESAVSPTSANVTVTGQQEGAYFADGEAVVIGKTEGEYTKQVLWSGNVALNNASSFTLVYKLDGIETPINAYQLAIGYNGGADSGKGGHWFWDSTDNWGGAPSPRFQTFEENGLFMMYINNRLFDGKKFSELNEVRIFDGGCSRQPAADADEATKATFVPSNTNENATFQMLAVVGGTLKPTVTFHNTDGSVLTTYTQDYIGTEPNSGTQDGTVVKQVKALAAPMDIFLAAQAAVAEGEEPIATPVKESDIAEVEYVLDGWQDAEGNLVEGVYMSGDLYPHFKTVDNRTQYNVVFKNYDGTVLYETVVPEGETPAYPAELGTPRKPSTETNSFVFNGWDPAIAAMPTTPEADGATAPDAVVYTAQYDQTERRYDVIFYAEDGQTILDEALYLVYGTEAKYEGETPTKEADAQYTYTFEKWVDFEGKDVDLTKVTADLEVKPAFKGTLNKYTVTFDVDGTITEVEVEYGTAATAPEATKEADKWYTYEFDKWVDAEGNEADISEIKGDVTVYASFTAIFTPPYIDLVDMEPDDWYAPAVEYVLVNGIMNGVSGDTFSLDTNMTRAMVVTVLHRYLGEPAVELPEDFKNFADNTDESKWYYNAVVWAQVNEVVNGKGDGFDPDGNVTRQEFVTILYRFADQVMGEYVGSGRATIASFADKAEIDQWAHNAVKWAYATAEDMNTQGYIAYDKTQYINGKGTQDGMPLFAPKANATRAEVATMLFRYMTATRIPATA